MEAKLQIKTTHFVQSSTAVDRCPRTVYPEYAFAGRSNVGKSSLINYLLNRHKLAHTSSTPGKTLLINHYLVNGRFYFVDLPGYGYARTAKKEREKILAMIFSYIRTRKNLSCLFLLIDSRVKPLENDKLVIQWLGDAGIPFVLVFTKTDKLSASRLAKNLENYQKELMASWEELPPVFLTSSMKKKGREEILDYILKTGTPST
jgi:GTP-binding protein